MDVEDIVPTENVEAEKPADQGAGDAATSQPDRQKRRNKKYARAYSKDAVSSTSTLPKYRSWKNSRRSRNGYGRGLPKKGTYIYIRPFYLLTFKLCTLISF